MEYKRRENDQPTHERLTAIETIMKRWDKALFGNGQVGFITETRVGITSLDKRVSKQGVYWRIAIWATCLIATVVGAWAGGLFK